MGPGAGIGYGCKTPLLFIEGIPGSWSLPRGNDLTPVVLPFVRRHNAVFQ